jgi:hypothetical protein
MKFTPSVVNALKYYVYIYSHPITEEIFYVGKGKGNRVFAHLEDTKLSDKVLLLSELKELGLKPRIEILIHGLESEETALKVEASIIDLLELNKLTNIQSGHHSAKFGRMSIDQINSIYDKEEIEITEPSILIRINKAFRYSMPPHELYDFTRGIWKVSLKTAEKAKYAFAIYEGIIQEVYEIKAWFQANATFNSRTYLETSSKPMELQNYERYEFIGAIAPKSIRDKYRHKSVAHYYKRGNANPIMYRNLN